MSSKVKRLLGVSALAALLLVAMLGVIVLSKKLAEPEDPQ